MQDAGLGLLEPGIEATMALVLRGSIQRSYTSTGNTCTQQVYDPLEVTVRMKGYGYTLALLWVIIQFTFNLMALACYIPWWLEPGPILPAVELTQKSIIFSLFAAKNAPTMSRIKSMSSNLELALIWPRLDMVLRVGESIHSKEDPTNGVIVMDKPKMVVHLSYDKVYV